MSHLWHQGKLSQPLTELSGRDSQPFPYGRKILIISTEFACLSAACSTLSVSSPSSSSTHLWAVLFTEQVQSTPTKQVWSWFFFLLSVLFVCFSESFVKMNSLMVFWHKKLTHHVMQAEGQGKNIAHCESSVLASVLFWRAPKGTPGFHKTSFLVTTYFPPFLQSKYDKNYSSFIIPHTH